jgi:hypothetical protein
MIIDLEIFAWGICIAIAYAVFAMKLSAYGGRFRNIALDYGERILRDPTAPKSMKCAVRRTIRLPSSPSNAWWFVILLFPATVAVLVKRNRRERMRHRDADPSISRHSHIEVFTRYNEALSTAVLSNSPLAMLLYNAQLFVISTFVWPEVVLDYLTLNWVDHKASVEVAA